MWEMWLLLDVIFGLPVASHDVFRLTMLCRQASIVERITSPRYIYYPRIFHIHGYKSRAWLHAPHTPVVPLHYILWCGISFYAKHTIPARSTLIVIHMNNDLLLLLMYLTLRFRALLLLLLLLYDLDVLLWLNIGIVTARYKHELSPPPNLS